MSKVATAAAALGLLGAAAVGIVAIDSEVRDVAPVTADKAAEDHPYRYAVAEVACLEAEGITIDDVRRVCADHEVRGGYLGCVRGQTDPVHKCEVAREDLPAGAFQKFMGCRCTDGEETTDWVRLVPLSWVKPDNCNCITICDRVINSKSRKAVWSDLEECLEERCTGCDITPTSWGPCPHCLAPGRDCAAECAQ